MDKEDLDFNQIGGMLETLNKLTKCMKMVLDLKNRKDDEMISIRECKDLINSILFVFEFKIKNEEIHE
jgi:hypothetical protein